MTIRPIGSIGWRTVVSGGSVQFIRAESSKPTTDTSSGTRRPARRDRADRAEGHRVAGADDAGHAARRAAGAADAWAASSEYSEWAIRSGPELEAGRRRPTVLAALELAPRRHVVARPEQQADPRVAERDQVAHRLLDRRPRSSHDTRREAEPVDARVDEDRRQAALGEPAVVAVRRVGLGVEPAGEHHARDLLLEQQVDVVRLRHAADGLGAQDRREALLGEGARDDLGEGREDRVLELGQDEADEARRARRAAWSGARSPGRRAR